MRGLNLDLSSDFLEILQEILQVLVTPRGIANNSFLYGNFKYKTVIPSKTIKSKIQNHMHIYQSKIENLETFQEN